MSDRIVRVDPARWGGRSRSGPRPGPAAGMPGVPDFARVDAAWLTSGDIDFLMETTGQRPDPALERRHVALAVEPLLAREDVYRRVAGHTGDWIDISPQLYFHVVLRRFLPRPRNDLQRRAMRYVANLLGLFARTDRIYRVQPGEPRSFEYLVDLACEAAESDAERQFLVHAHLGNYALYQAGLNSDWIEHRFRYGKRLVDVGYYRDMGRGAYERAARHRLAADLGLAAVLARLAERFDDYADALRRIQRLWRSRPGATPRRR